MYVYFIRAGNSGPIKIGIASNIQSRMDTLQTGNHLKLTLVASIKCDSRLHALDKEKKLHKLFDYKKIRGEWFCGSIKLKDVDEFQENEKKLLDDKFQCQDSDRDLLSSCPF